MSDDDFEDDDSFDSDLCSLLSYKSFLDGACFATSAPPPTPAASQAADHLPPRKQKSPRAAQTTTTTVKSPRPCYIMKNTLITVNVTGPGKLAMTTPQRTKKARPKAAYQHGGNTATTAATFTTGLEHTSQEHLQDLFPPPLHHNQTLPTVQSLTTDGQPVVEEHRRRPDNNTSHPSREHQEQQHEQDSKSGSPTRFYYRFYPNSDMTQRERHQLGYKACATPTITASVGGRKGRTPNRWGSACSMRSMDYHLAELSLYYRGATVAAPVKLRSLKGRQQDHESTTVTDHMHGHRQRVASTAGYDYRPMTQSSQQSLGNTATPPLDQDSTDRSAAPLTVSQRQFQKRNQLLREQMAVYIQWKTAEQLKEREHLAKRGSTAPTTERGARGTRRGGRESILSSGKERRLQMFNSLLKEQEMEYAEEMRQNEAAEFVLSSRSSMVDQQGDEGEEKEEEEEEEGETVREDEWVMSSERDNKLTQMWQMLQ